VLALPFFVMIGFSYHAIANPNTTGVLGGNSYVPSLFRVHRRAVAHTGFSHWYMMIDHGFLPLKPNDTAVPGARGNAEGNKWPRKHPIQPSRTSGPERYGPAEGHPR
jgi:hypothetical protein